MSCTHHDGYGTTVMPDGICLLCERTVPFRERYPELLALSTAAAPGPWVYAEPPYYIVDANGEHVHSDSDGLGASYFNDATRDLIVESVNLVRVLLAADR